ncbi:response regulator [Thermobifida cellulosilytica]|uniref:response regulator n=1 Tax=Thermobifida cellulosilytica TaxID=144786 RepID=UPI00373FCF50
MSTYQVMIGVHDDELENALTARFEEIADAEVVGAFRSSHEISDALSQFPALDVVLIHEDLGPLPVLELIRDISRNRPQLAVILIVDEISPALFTSAVEAGARGLLQSDATIEELSARVSSAAEWSRTLRRHLEAASLDLPMAGRRGRIITLTGAKGGVGTTTTAIHLARMAAGWSAWSTSTCSPGTSPATTTSSTAAASSTWSRPPTTSAPRCSPKPSMCTPTGRTSSWPPSTARTGRTSPRVPPDRSWERCGRATTW